LKNLGLEDNQGNPSRDLMPYFNTENENVLTISVIYAKIKIYVKVKSF
jgi:hypothetical protein